MKPLVAAVALAALVLLLAAACTGGGRPSIRVTLQADTTLLPPGADIDDALDGVKDILERRLDALGVSGNVIREGEDRLVVEVSGITAQEVEEVLGKTAQLVFRKPVRDAAGDIVCDTASGITYAEPFQPGLFVEDEVNDTVTCPPNEEGMVGVVVWEPATGIKSQGTESVLTGSFLKTNSRVEGPPPTVVIEFTGEGSLLFEQITTELVGLPLGIFLDDELIGAPSVSQPITGGNATITGLDLDEARTLSIQLNAGALPAPIRVIDIEEIP